MTWMPGTYDPELNLIYLRHRQSESGDAPAGPQGRQPVHLLDRGAEAGHRQDGVVFPAVAARHARLGRRDRRRCLIDASSTASRASCWRRPAATATSFCSTEPTARTLIDAVSIDLNWSKGVDAKGQPIPDPAKEPKTDGALVSPSSGGATNWPPPSFDPETGLFYVAARSPTASIYLTDTERKPEGYGGRDRPVWSQSVLVAIDYKTGKIRWRHMYPGRGFHRGHADDRGQAVVHRRSPAT